jgi:hypothetical protein
MPAIIVKTKLIATSTTASKMFKVAILVILVIKPLNIKFIGILIDK